MRLTLRTLLAYNDNVLNPGDHAELHRRIQQNQDIGRLQKRIERLTNESEMHSPRMNAPGLAGDPNAIAEYLDDTLTGANVAELERMCLNSDENLAELAHCHRLLATAMHTPVSIPESLRRLAVELIDPARRAEIESRLLTRSGKRKRSGTPQVVATVVDEETTSSPSVYAAPVVDAASTVPAPMVASGGGSIRPEGLDLEDSKLTREVPEYLLGTKRGAWRTPIAIAAVTLILAFMVWQSLGPWDKVRSLLVSSTGSQQPKDPPLRVRQLEQATPDDSMFHELIVSAEEPPLPKPGDKKPASDDRESSNSDTQVADVATEPTVDNNDLDASSDGIDESEIDAPPMPEAVAGNSDAGVDDGAEIDASDSAPPLPTVAPESTPPTTDIAADIAASVDGPTPPTELDNVAAAVWAPQDDAQRNAAILTFANGTVTRVAAGESLEGRELIVPPYTRTMFALPADIQWTACGPSELAFRSEKGQPIVESRMCQAFVNCNSGHPLNVVTPLGSYRIQSESQEAVVAVDLEHRLSEHGSMSDPNLFISVLVVTVVEGVAKIEELGDSGPTAEYSLEIGESLGVQAGAQPVRFKMQSIPRWFRSSTNRASDQLAMDDFVSALDVAAAEQKSVQSVLDELAVNRRSETAALAVQVNTMSGNWQPFVNSFLTEDRFRSHWNRAIELARQIAAHQSSYADDLQAAMVSAYGQESGEQAYGLFKGIPADMLATDSVASLIGQLESPSLPNRVLAAYQLEALTGKLQAYQPHAPNKNSLQQWRRDLATKRIAILPISDVFYERRLTADVN